MLVQSAWCVGCFPNWGNLRSCQEPAIHMAVADGTWAGPGAKDKREKLLEWYHAFPGIDRADRKHDREESLSSLCLAEHGDLKEGGSDTATEQQLTIFSCDFREVTYMRRGCQILHILPRKVGWHMQLTQG